MRSNNHDETRAPAQRPLHERLKLISIGILLIGLLCSALIYFKANDELDGVIGYEVEGGQVFPVTQGEYKRSEFELEKVGGKFAVISAELDDWFAGLWHGKRLGVTLAVLSVSIAGVVFFFSYLLSFQPPADNAPDSNQ